MFIAAGSDFSGGEVGGNEDAARCRNANRRPNGGGKGERLRQVRLIKETDVRAGNAKRQDSSIFRKGRFLRKSTCPENA